MSEAKHTPWRVGKDMFGSVHVFDNGGSRLTNDRMCGTEGWEDHARLIAAAPEMLNAMKELKERFGEIANYAHNTQGPVCSGDMRAIGAQMADIWRDVGEPAVAKAEAQS